MEGAFGFIFKIKISGVGVVTTNDGIAGFAVIACWATGST